MKNKLSFSDWITFLGSEKSNVMNTMSAAGTIVIAVLAFTLAPEWSKLT